jgi:hypothetical protein
MMRSDRPIQPIRKSRLVPLSVAEAFDLFTTRMDAWWPLTSHSISGSADATVRFDPWVGGAVEESAPSGASWRWAEVMAWDPPHRFVLSWHPHPAPVAASILEVRFTAEGAGCRIDLEHRGWEEFGHEAGTRHRDAYDPGWDEVLLPLTERAGART